MIFEELQRLLEASNAELASVRLERDAAIKRVEELYAQLTREKKRGQFDYEQDEKARAENEISEALSAERAHSAKVEAENEALRIALRPFVEEWRSGKHRLPPASAFVNAARVLGDHR